jgi:tagatose 6-phosphate kinase
LVEEHAPVAPADYNALLAILGKHLDTARGLVLSGSLPPGGPQDFYRCCIEQANARRVPVVLDTRGQPLLEALAARPMLVKCNWPELEETVGGIIADEAALGAVLAKLIAAGPQWAVVTHGGQPALASDGRTLWRIVPPRIAAISPVGSGDAFSAGLMAALAQGQPLPQAFTLAAACGAANALVPVAGVVYPKDIAVLQPQVKIERIE